MAPSAKTKKKRLIFLGLGLTAMAAVIIVPISIEVSQDKNAIQANVDGRIECFPLSKFLYFCI